MNIKAYLKQINHNETMSLQETKQAVREKNEETMSQWELELLMKEIQAYYQEKEKQERILKIKEQEQAIKTEREDHPDKVEYKKHNESMIKFKKGIEQFKSKHNKFTSFMTGKTISWVIAFLTLYCLVSCYLIMNMFVSSLGYWQIIYYEYINLLYINRWPFVVLSAALLVILLFKHTLESKNERHHLMLGALIISNIILATSTLRLTAVLPYVLDADQMLSSSSGEDIGEKDEYRYFSDIISTNEIVILDSTTIIATVLSSSYIIYLVLSAVTSTSFVIHEQKTIKSSE